MQPDPSAFLRGIRQELLKTGHAKLAAGDMVPAVTLLRGAEIAAHLQLRHERLPALLDGFYSRQHELLLQSVDALAGLGIGVPDAASGALNLSPEYDPIARYDAMVAAQSACIAALGNATNAAATSLRRDILHRACRLDGEIRSARAKALQEVMASGQVEKAADSIGVPSDEIITTHLREHFPQYSDLRAFNVHQQKGVNTKEVFFMEIEGHPDWPRQAVMRRNRAVDPVGNEVSSEYGILDYVHRHGVLAARPLFAGAALGDQQRPFVVLERLPGRAQGGAELGDGARGVLLDLARHLARLHRVDVRGLPDAYRPYGKMGTSARQRTLNMIDRFYRLWQGDNCQPSLATEAAFVWLRENVDIVDEQLSIVHGDYSLRNNLSHEGRASGILDWELAHEGHPGEDLGYVRLDVEGVMPWDDFMQAYLDAGGVEVPDRVIRYFRIYGIAFIISTLYTACNGYLVGRHDDMLIGAAGIIEFSVFEPMLSRFLVEELEQN